MSRPLRKTTKRRSHLRGDSAHHRQMADGLFYDARRHLDIARRAAKGGNCKAGLRNLVAAAGMAGAYDSQAVEVDGPPPHGGAGALDRDLETVETAVVKACKP